ncbi:metallophosphoesterase [Luteimonas sp. RIT-PG2_3]
MRPESDALRLIPDGFRAKGISTLVGPDGAIKAQWIKTAADDERQQEMMLAAIEAMSADLPRVKARLASGEFNADLLAVYPIGDPHVGMYSWAAETGDDWDLSIAERMHCEAMAALVAAAPASEEALIVNLGDLFHYDSLEAKTPRSGHMLDADGRYAKMIAVGVKIMRQCIESALAKHQRVHVINAPGNHDETGALWLSVALSNVYENEPRVTVDRNPSVFAYHRFGKVLLGVHHGHVCKPDKLPGVMAADRAKDWGDTEHRHWLMGHIHHESRKEFAGVTVESFGTLAGKDAYATSGGWRSARAMQSIVYHRQHGEVARSRVNAQMFEGAA